MDMLITNVTVVTCDADGSIIRDGALAVVDGRLAAVGETAALERQYHHLHRVDARGKAALPGLINAHTHTVLTVIRGTVEDMDVDSVYAYMTPITFAMTDDERGAMAALGCLESIRCGAATLVDPLRFVDGYAQHMVGSGLRLFLSESCADALTLEIRHGRYEYSREWGEAFLERAENLVERFHGADGGRVQCQIAAHATENCSPWMLSELLKLAQKHKLRRTVHLAQSGAEVRQTAKLSGKGSTPAEYLRDNDWLGPDVLAAHWSFCTEDDIALLAESGTHMAHCPASSSRRGSHAGANMPAIVDAGVNVALGTDNMSEDMWQALSVGIIVNRGKRGGGPVPTPRTMLEWATRNGARSLGREDDLGSLEPGKLADVTLVDLRRPHLTPANNLLSNLVHYGQAGDVDTLIVGGEFVMRDGKVMTMNEEDVIRNAREATGNAWARLAEQFPDIPPASAFLDGA